MKFDVVVVGAGPAGSVASRELARRGVRVLLLEEHQSVGVPVHCSGLVTPRTLEAAGVSQDLVINRIKGAHIHSPTGWVLTLGGDKTRALVIDRCRLDQVLAEQAQEAGATLMLGTRLMALERVDGRLRLHIRRNGTTTHMETDLLVAGDGSLSAVARQLGQTPEESVAVMGGEVAAGGLDPEYVEVFLGDDTAPGWFGWLIPVEGEVTRIGVGSTDRRRSPRQLLGRMCQSRDILKGARVLRLQGSVIPLRCSRRLYDRNVLLVGDAGGQVKPTSGGGIYTSIVAAKLSARAAEAALGSGDFSARSLSRYQDQWGRSVQGELVRGMYLRQLFLSLTPAEVDGALRALARPALQALVLKKGDIDFPGRLFSSLLGLPTLLQSATYLPLSFWPKAVRLLLRWQAYSTLSFLTRRRSPMEPHRRILL